MVLGSSLGWTKLENFSKKKSSFFWLKKHPWKVYIDLIKHFRPDLTDRTFSDSGKEACIEIFDIINEKLNLAILGLWSKVFQVLILQRKITHFGRVFHEKEIAASVLMQKDADMLTQTFTAPSGRTWHSWVILITQKKSTQKIYEPWIISLSSVNSNSISSQKVKRKTVL